MSTIPVAPAIAFDLNNHCEHVRLHKANSNYNLDDPDLSLHDLNKYSNKTITSIKSVAQSGPNCGLAALAMIATPTPSELSLDNIFNEATSRGFTNKGEMFSADNMKILAEVFFSAWYDIELFCNGLEANKQYVIDNIKKGNLMLIPYDADKDHSPCCMKGHKAHWAVVCGILNDNGEVYLAAKHGKSRYLAVWPFECMKESNDNLYELDPKSSHNYASFIMPDGGVKAGLASQFLIFKKKDLL